MQPDRLALSRRGPLRGGLAMAAAPRDMAAQAPAANAVLPFADRLGVRFGMVPPVPDDPDDPPRVAFR